MKTLAYVIIATVLSISMHTMLAQNEAAQVQQLHQVISNDLIKIRKTFPESQRTVYTLLDQVCKIYKISKQKIEMESQLKVVVKDKVTQIITLKKENTLLKAELENLKGELETTKENLTSTAKELETNQTTLEDLKKEKEKIEAERMLLVQEREKLLKLQESVDQKTMAKNHQYPAHMKHRKYNVSNNQSLNLTSTSEPISPL